MDAVTVALRRVVKLTSQAGLVRRPGLLVPLQALLGWAPKYQISNTAPATSCPRRTKC